MTQRQTQKLFIVGMGLWMMACGGTSIFPPIETNMSNPLTVAVDSTNARAYVVNANNKVVYNGGSLHVVSLESPALPRRVNLAALESFAGQVFLDATNRIVYIPNRQSENADDKSDHVTRIDVNETAGTFLNTTHLDADGDPFGSARYATQNWLLVPSREGFLDYYEMGRAAPTVQHVDLKRDLSDGTTLSRADVTDIVVIGTQAVLSRASGGLLIVNLNELTNVGGNPVDYFITSFASPRGLATDGKFVYVVNVQTAGDGTRIPSVQVIDISSLPPTTSNVTTGVRDTSNLSVGGVVVGKDPQQIVLGTTEGFVSNLGDNSVSVFNLATRNKVADISVGTEPFGLALYSPGGVNTHLLVCNIDSNTVSIINIASRQIIATYP